MFEALEEAEFVGGKVGCGGAIVAALGHTKCKFKVRQCNFGVGAGWAEDCVSVDINARVEVGFIFVVTKDIMAAYIVVESLDGFGDVVLGARMFDAKFEPLSKERSDALW